MPDRIFTDKTRRLVEQEEIERKGYIHTSRRGLNSHLDDSDNIDVFRSVYRP